MSSKAKLKRSPVKVRAGLAAVIIKDGEFHSWVGDPHRGYDRFWRDSERNRLESVVRLTRRTYREKGEDVEVIIVNLQAEES